MRAEDIDRALAALSPAGEARLAQPELAPAGQVIRATFGAVARAERAAVDDQARAAALEAQRERIRRARRALEPRLHRRLLAALRAHRSPCALLLGPTGVGKTTAAQWLRAGMPGEWFQARDLAACERRHPLGEGTPPAFDRACSARVLYLDDLGAEDARDVGVLQHVLDRRYAASRPVVTTTGLTRAQLTERYGAPTVRRLTDQHAPRRDGSLWPVLVVDLHEGVTP